MNKRFEMRYRDKYDWFCNIREESKTYMVTDPFKVGISTYETTQNRKLKQITLRWSRPLVVGTTDSMDLEEGSKYKIWIMYGIY